MFDDGHTVLLGLAFVYVGFAVATTDVVAFFSRTILGTHHTTLLIFLTLRADLFGFTLAAVFAGARATVNGLDTLLEGDALIVIGLFITAANRFVQVGVAFEGRVNTTSRSTYAAHGVGIIAWPQSAAQTGTVMYDVRAVF